MQRFSVAQARGDARTQRCRCSSRCRLLGLVVLHGGLNGILGKHAAGKCGQTHAGHAAGNSGASAGWGKSIPAVQLDWGELQMSRNVLVLDVGALLNVHALDPFSGNRAAGHADVLGACQLLAEERGLP